MTHAHQACLNPRCGATYDVGEILTGCPACPSLLDIRYDWDKIAVPKSLSVFEKRWSNRPRDVHYFSFVDVELLKPM